MIKISKLLVEGFYSIYIEDDLIDAVSIHPSDITDSDWINIVGSGFYIVAGTNMEDIVLTKVWGD